jgi:hypothetical protein
MSTVLVKVSTDVRERIPFEDRHDIEEQLTGLVHDLLGKFVGPADCEWVPLGFDRSAEDIKIEFWLSLRRKVTSLPSDKVRELARQAWQMTILHKAAFPALRYIDIRVFPISETSQFWVQDPYSDKENLQEYEME